MIVKLFSNGLPKWGSLLLAPFLLNYLLSWNLWRRMEKNKRLSWIPALVNCYPQYNAAKVIHAFWTNPQGAQKKKNTFLREASEIEVFAESVFTVLVMTFLMVMGLKVKKEQEKDKQERLSSENTTGTTRPVPSTSLTTSTCSSSPTPSPSCLPPLAWPRP